MSFNVELTESALEDIQEIKFYISTTLKNPETAVSIVESIVSTVEKLKIFPKVHRVRKTHLLHGEIRFVPVSNYTVLYSVNDDKSIVSILRVVYGRRNISEII